MWRDGEILWLWSEFVGHWLPTPDALLGWGIEKTGKSQIYEIEERRIVSELLIWIT